MEHFWSLVDTMHSQCYSNRAHDPGASTSVRFRDMNCHRNFHYENSGYSEFIDFSSQENIAKQFQESSCFKVNYQTHIENFTTTAEAAWLTGIQTVGSNPVSPEHCSFLSGKTTLASMFQKGSSKMQTSRNTASVARRNARERRRIKNVNQAFDDLRKRVPTGAGCSKISKVKIKLKFFLIL